MFEKVAPYIFYDEAYLSSDETKSVSSELETWDGWIPAHAGRYKDDKLIDSEEIKELRDVLVNRKSFSKEIEHVLRFDDVLKESRRLYKINNITRSPYVVSKYAPHCHIKPHTDTDFFNTSRIFTGIHYLSDDYEGGEIFFPKFNVQIKPKAGSLLLFFSEYLHGVKPIISGNRFAVVWFGQAEKL